MIVSNHAKEEAEKSSISEEEISQCLKFGVLKFSQIVNGECRYAKQFELCDKTIIVIYTIRSCEERIITTYCIRRKKIWVKK